MSIENFGLNSPVRTIIEQYSDKEGIEWRGPLPYYKGLNLFPLLTEEDEDLLRRLFEIPQYEEKSEIGLSIEEIECLQEPGNYLCIPKAGTGSFNTEEKARLRELDKYLDIPKVEEVCTDGDYYAICEHNYFRKYNHEEILEWSRKNSCPGYDNTVGSSDDE